LRPRDIPRGREKDMSHEILGVGLAGLGRHGMRYAQHLLAGDAPRAHLVAVHRRNREQGAEWASTRRLRFHDSLEALAADPEVDFIVAVLPPARHPDAVRAAAAARKPILVEKPLANSVAAAREALAAARAAGIPAMVAHTMRFNSIVRALKEMAPEVGPLHLVAINNRFEPADRAWFNDPVQGGMVVNTGVHGTDLLRFLTGAEIVAAQAWGERVVLQDMDDVFAALLRLEPGPIIATMDNTWATGGRTGRVELVGRDGQLVVDHIHGHLSLVRGRREERLPVPPPVPTVREILRAFTGCLIDGDPIPVPLEDGLAAVAGAELIARALAERREVR
jgi:predicted dehydrogenase